nr:non-ribosomal peptide synthase/polyketide synthase [Pseudomonas sp. 1239]
MNLYGVAPISPRDPQEPLALSYAQQRQWFLWQLEPQGTAYNVPMALRLTGELDIEALRASFQALIERHEVLRTTFHHDGEQAVQRIQPAAPFDLPVQVLEDEAGVGLEHALKHQVDRETQQPFDLEAGPLLRVKLLRLAPREHALVLTLHHIVSDGWSMPIIVDELIQGYEALRSGQAVQLPALPIQYADYALWQRQWMEAGEQERQLAYWQARLGGDQPVLELPTDHPRPAVQSHAGANLGLELSAELAQRLKALAQQQGVTLFMLLLASFQTLLHRYCGQPDIRVGVPIANRNRAETEHLIGFFVNTQVLKADFTLHTPFTALLQQVKQAALDAQAHQDLPFEQLVDALESERSLSHSPLFQVMFNHQADAGPPARTLAELTVQVLAWDKTTAQFDLALNTIEHAEGIAASLTYATDLFEPGTIQRLLGHWHNLLQGIVEQPQRTIAELPLLDAQQRQQLLGDWNRTEAHYPAEACVHTLFEAQVARTPQAVALVHGEQELTYQQLNRRANQLAHRLRELGVGPDVRVAVALERTPDLVVALLGILKAGGAYVPLDPEYPQERLAYMMRDSQALLLLSQSTLLARLPEAMGARTLLLDQVQLDACGADNPLNHTHASNLAYSIYTSGSTGLPKGVLIEHRNTVALIEWARTVYSTDDLQGVLASTSICFDLSVWEIFVTLACGGYAVLADNALELPTLAARSRVRLVNTVPSAIKALRDAGQLPDSVRVVNLAGEALKQSLVDQLYQAGHIERVYDLYGPSEDTTYSTYTARTLHGRATIGRPISNSRVYLLDAAAAPVPVGAAGELYLAGAGLARGYAGRAALTAEKFLPDPFDTSAQGGGRLYRTGDLARYRDNGLIEYAGRIDHQVKIRGFRIELGEIEARLQAHPAIGEAVVIDVAAASGRQLVAYLVPASPTAQAPDTHSRLRNDLREHLRRALPDYMVPAHLMFLDALPLTPNGKLNRKALPAPEASQLQQSFVAPQSEMEQRIAAIWAGVLKVDQVGLTDNFFELGGDSIISIQVVSRARQAGIHFTPKQLFQHQTVQGLASVARRGEPARQIDQGPVSGPALLLPIHQHFFDAAIPQQHHWNQALLLTPGRALNASTLGRALEALVAHHDALRLHYARQADGSWAAQHGAVQVQPERLWLAEVATADELQALCEKAQRSLNLERGELLRAVLATLADGSQRLLVAIHHLVVDGVSWRILLEDLQTACTQLDAGQAVNLPAKTSSTQAWAQRLQAHSGDLQAQLSYWTGELAGTCAELPCDNPQGSLQSLHGTQVNTRLDPASTRQLLQQAPAAYRTQVNDLLLTALARVIARWTGRDDVLIQLEGHGREDLFDDIDLTRTVGWFTSLFPVKLSPSDSLDGSIKRIKEQLRAVPDKGLGFGALRYLGDAQARDALAALPVPRITFNYLGQVDGSFAGQAGEAAFLAPAGEHPGASQSVEAPLGNWLSIDGQVYGGELTLGWRFSQDMFSPGTIQALADAYARELTALVAHCTQAGSAGATPSDFPLAGLSQAQLDSLPIPLAAIDDIYPLSPMQQGMLFHTLYEQGEGHYINQMRVDVHGLEVERFEQAWRDALARHEVLRASFVTAFEQPLQVIRKHVELPFVTLDWRARPALQHSLDHWAEADRQRGFDLQQAPLLRLAVIRTAEQRHHLIYTSHHILMDGWSNSQLLGEVLQRYAGQVSVPLAGRYRDYIEWLGAQDAAQAEAFWQQQLLALSEPTRLAQAIRSEKTTLGSGQANHYQVLDRTLLSDFARQQRVTVNTLVQAAWLLLLQRYTGQACVCVGATVSGRPAQLSGVEQQLGLFINTLPLVASPSPAQAVGQWLEQLQAQNLALREHEHSPLNEIQRWAGLGGEGLFDTLLVFENYPVAEALQQGAPAGLVFGNVDTHEQTNYPLTLAIGLGDELSIHYAYDQARFSRHSVEQIARHFANLLNALVQDPQRRIAELAVLQAQEQQQIVQAWNPQAAAYPGERCIHERIAEQAEQSPHAIAVVCGEQALSYQQLNQRANQLAHRLRERGVGPDVRVGLAVERSLEMVVGIVGILKAGGAYVPLDPEYPQDRLAYMIEDSGITLLLTQAHLELPAAASVERVILESGQAWLEGCSTANPVNHTTPANLAYVIYTSGSTGKPKGTLLAHHNVMRLFDATQDWFAFDSSDVWSVFHSYAFDFSVWELFGALLHGAKAVVVPREVARSPQDFHALLVREQVTVLNQTPSAFKQLVPVACASPSPLALRYVVFGGEALDVASLKPWFERFGDRQPQLINMYGITETTVHVTYRPLSLADLEQDGVSPIGAVIPDLSWYLLDSDFNLVAPGCQGELHVGQAGLARGYHQRAALTALRFVPDPFDTSAQGGGRLYRTGDLARYRGDGVIEYVGRIDHQVKIRGFRIELGEIEARLQAHAAVREAVVLDIDGATGKQLVAYLLTSAPATAELRAALREHLKATLPDYMVPAHLVFLDAWPLTGNGKLDRRALPKPDASQLQQAYVAPQSELEQQIAAIWAGVLKLEQVGLTDNFFELGGDSIVSIQLVSRARQAGIHFTPKELFQHQTVQGLATVARRGELGQQVDQGAMSGQALLLPIHQYFFEAAIPQRHHWNQSLLLAPGQGLQASLLERALQALVVQHDALRLNYAEQADGRWGAQYGGLGGQALVWSAQVADEQALQALCDKAQRSLDLHGGPLLRAVLATLADGSQRLLLAIHHLVVDGVSWRILLEDLQTAYTQLDAGQAVSLPAKTSSTQAWAQRLQAHAGDLQAQLSYWTGELAGTCAELPCDNPRGSLQGVHGAQAQTRLDPATTRQLLQQAPAAYRTQVNDLLLTALARVIARWTGRDDVLIQLEGHGREDLFDELDLTRTVGWFTSMFPVKLSPADSLAGSIKRIKEQLRAIPDKGIGFGALRYLGNDQARAALAALPVPRITFNYLGQFDASFVDAQGEAAFFTPAMEHAGDSQSPEAPLGNWLSINGQVYGGELKLSWSFSREMFDAATIEALAQDYTRELTALVVHCTQADNIGATPSDFPLAGLSQAQLDNLPMPLQAIDDIYPLSPMQQGMLFYSQQAPETALYVNQIAVPIDGLDSTRFIGAWHSVLERYDILRTGFWSAQQLAEPLQVVYRQAELPVRLLDWSAREDSAQALEALAAADAAQGFDLSVAPLIRLTLVKLDDTRTHLLWTSHHILMDGWSSSRLIAEVFLAYHGQPGSQPVGRYRDYIRWLGRQSQTELERFWSTRLHSLDGPTLLADNVAPRPQAASGGHAALYLNWDAARTEHLRNQAQRLRVTPNTLVQGAWLLLLQRYTGQRTVCFGATVAGRPASLPGVNEMLGLFINTLPVVQTPEPHQRVSDWLSELQGYNLELRDHEHAALADVQRWAGRAGQALFDSIVVFENYPVDERLKGASDSSLQFGETSTRDVTNYAMDLAVNLGQTLSIEFLYLTERFTEQAVAAILGNFERLLGALLDNPQATLGSLDMLTDGQTVQLQQRNQLPPSAVPAPLLATTIAGHARQRPHAQAVVCGARQLSYAELDAQANRLAHHLIALGARPERCVGIALERSVETIVAFLAVMKTGAGYVALDVDYPQDRLQWIVEDSAMSLLLTHSTLAPRFEVSAPVVELDRVDLSALASSCPSPTVSADNLAYLIYTSGSTGKPKGVAVSHGQIGMHCRAIAERYEMDAATRELLFMSFAFDGAQERWLSTLQAGGCLVVRDNRLWSAEETLQVLQAERIDIACFPPAYLQQMVEYAEALRLGPPPVRVYCFGGDAVPDALFEAVKRVLQPQWLVNGYGPTETVVTPLLWKVPGTQRCEAVYAPIGERVGQRTLYVLDENLNPLPDGVAGELYVGGAGVARGYHQRAGLTAERFVADPFAQGARLYRTGDRVCRRSDGVIDYLGRLDNQMKIRGFRIEPGEIEARLRNQPGVGNAVVTAREIEGNQQLLAYIVTTAEAASGEQLREVLRGELPDYMVPAHIMVMAQLPLTPNGKLDRNALPAPQFAHRAWTAPRNAVEQALAAIWQEVLDVEAVGIDDNFFELGGDSLRMLKMLSRVRASDSVDIELKLRDVMARPTIGELSGYAPDTLHNLDPLLLLNTAVANVAPLFCLHAGFGTVFDYEPLARRLDGHCSVYGLQCRMLLEPAWVDDSLQAMAIDYAQYIRQKQPQGPYRLLGWSLGGALALLVAQELEGQGQQVALLGLVDSFLPSATAVLPVTDCAADLRSFLAVVLQAAGDTLVLPQAVAADLEDAALAGVIEQARSALPGAGYAQLSSAELAHTFGVGMRLKALSGQLQQLPGTLAQPCCWWAGEAARVAGSAEDIVIAAGHYDLLGHPDLLEGLAARLTADVSVAG